MKIVVLIDIEALPDNDPQLQGRNQEVRSATEYHVVDGLRQLGHEVMILAFGPDIVATIHGLIEIKPDLVFNLTEHFKGDRRRDMNIAALLELLRLPYTGSGPDGLLLCRDKAMCKRVLGHHRIRIPQFATVPASQAKPKGRIPYPMIVKPVYEDGSDGISLASLVGNEDEMKDRVRMIHERMKQPAICEEYVEGRELYVGIIGNEKLTAFPARELRFGNTGEGGPNIATAMVKRNAAYRKKWSIAYEHADLPKDLEKKAARL
ncbi:MAG: ATP-grasp domain-containing protein, partial [Kiritimatiellae bacterium]|nr:ATP-grasp domain-containing protein [Kiritimatiellia bacterium]